MNSDFIIKMVKAEMLRYEAIKEILPESLKTKFNCLESEFKDIVKQLAVEIIKESVSQKEEEHKCDARKISVDFDN